MWEASVRIRLEPQVGSCPLVQSRACKSYPWRGMIPTAKSPTSSRTPEGQHTWLTASPSASKKNFRLLIRDVRAAFARQPADFPGFAGHRGTGQARVAPIHRGNG